MPGAPLGQAQGSWRVPRGLTTLSGRRWPGRYLTFSCRVLMMSLSRVPPTSSSKTQRLTAGSKRCSRAALPPTILAMAEPLQGHRAMEVCRDGGGGGNLPRRGTGETGRSPVAGADNADLLASHGRSVPYATLCLAAAAALSLRPWGPPPGPPCGEGSRARPPHPTGHGLGRGSGPCSLPGQGEPQQLFTLVTQAARARVQQLRERQVQEGNRGCGQTGAGLLGHHPLLRAVSVSSTRITFANQMKDEHGRAEPGQPELLVAQSMADVVPTCPPTRLHHPRTKEGEQLPSFAGGFYYNWVTATRTRYKKNLVHEKNNVQLIKTVILQQLHLPPQYPAPSMRTCPEAPPAAASALVPRKDTGEGIGERKGRVYYSHTRSYTDTGARATQAPRLAAASQLCQGRVCAQKGCQHHDSAAISQSATDF